VLTCADVRDRLSDLADEVLPSAERAACEAHLATCPDCAREWEGFRATVAVLRGLAPVRTPAGFVDRVLAAARPAPWWRRLARALFVPWRVKLPLEAAAAALVVVVMAVLLVRTPALEETARPEPLDAPTRESDTWLPAAQRSRPAPDEQPASDAQVVFRSSAGEAPHSEQAGEPHPAPESPPAGQAPRARSAPGSPDAAEGPARDAAGPAAPPQPAAQRPEPAQAPDPQQQAGPTAPPPPGEPPRPGEAMARRPAPAGEPGVRQPRAAPPADRLVAAAGAPEALVEGSLIVADREAAERALAELTGRTGGADVERHAAGDVLVISVRLPGPDSYAGFARGLATIGTWRQDRGPADPAGPVRVVVRVSAPAR
jgi:hypothetical protein